MCLKKRETDEEEDFLPADMFLDMWDLHKFESVLCAAGPDPCPPIKVICGLEMQL